MGFTSYFIDVIILHISFNQEMNYKKYTLTGDHTCSLG